MRLRLAAAVAAVGLVVIVGLYYSASSPEPARHAVPPAPTTAPTTAPPTTTTVTTEPPAPTTTTVPAEPPAPAAAAPSTYTVATGDTLAAIAAAHGLDWRSLCAANHLADCNLIFPGQVLNLTATPAVRARVDVPPAPPGPPAPLPSKPVPTRPVAAVPDCSAALNYLAAHAAPGFAFVCGKGAAMGHYGLTCFSHPPQCAAGSKVIYISCPLPFVYENEAQNSYVLTGGPGRIDAYGQGTPSEDAICNRYL